MHTNTITKVISGKMYSWCNSIDPNLFLDSSELDECQTEFERRDKVHSIVMPALVVAGGCIASMVADEQINDFDVYFSDPKVAVRLARYYRNKFAESYATASQWEVVNQDCRVKVGYSYGDDDTDNSQEIFAKIPIPDEKYEPYAFSMNAITLTNGIQLILRFVGTPEYVMSNFDFLHAMNYWTRETGTQLDLEAVMCIINKRLKFHHTLYPVCSLFRIRKFLERGYNINAAEMFKIAFAIQGLDLQDPYVLKDQLIGVDALYFSDFLGRLNALKDTLPEERGEYQGIVFGILDEVFDGTDSEFVELVQENL